MSVDTTAACPLGRILIVRPEIKDTLRALVLQELRKVEAVRDVYRRHAMPCEEHDKRADVLRSLAAELAL